MSEQQIYRLIAYVVSLVIVFIAVAVLVKEGVL